MTALQGLGVDVNLAVMAVFAAIANVVVGDVRLICLCPFMLGRVGIAALAGVVWLVLVERVAVVVDEAKVRQQVIDAHAVVTAVTKMAGVNGRVHTFFVRRTGSNVTTFISLSVTIVVPQVAAEIEGLRRYLPVADKSACAVTGIDACLTDADAQGAIGSAVARLTDTSVRRVNTAFA